jgi:transposase
MARGTKKDIPVAIRKLVVHLYLRGRKQADIVIDLQISHRSVKNILHRYRLEREGLAPPVRRRGRPRTLTVMDVDVSAPLLRSYTP